MNSIISVIICTYNREKYIEESILSIIEQEVDKYELELIVVNNNSTDSTHEICQLILSKYPSKNIIYYIEKEQGLSNARNRGINLANGNILVFLDDDAMARPQFLQVIGDDYSADELMQASGGRIYPRFESKAPRWMSPFLLPLMSVLDKGEQKIPFKGSSYPIGANMAFRKSVIEKVGYFNINLGRSGKNLQGGEEKDIFNRMKDLNLNIYYLPNACVDHVIPDARLDKTFIKKMGLGIGSSEQIRAKQLSNSDYFVSITKELGKWFASFLLFIFYTLTFRISKGIMLIQFRSWVSRGLVSKI